VGCPACFRQAAALPVERSVHQPDADEGLACALGLEIFGGQMACYVPPCSTQKWLDRVAFMERRAIAGGRSRAGSTSSRAVRKRCQLGMPASCSPTWEASAWCRPETPRPLVGPETRCGSLIDAWSAGAVDDWKKRYERTTAGHLRRTVPLQGLTSEAPRRVGGGDDRGSARQARDFRRRGADHE
jgi:hypothetical protein